MYALFLLFICLLFLFGTLRILCDLQNDPTLTVYEIAKLNLNRLKNLFKCKKIKWM